MFNRSLGKSREKRHPFIALAIGSLVFAIMFGLLSQIMIANVSIRPAYLSFIFFLSLSTGGITTGTIFYYYTTTVTEYKPVLSKKRRLV
jgi:hypothetical protein